MGPEQTKQRSLTKIVLEMFYKNRILSIYALIALVLVIVATYLTQDLAKQISLLFFNLDKMTKVGLLKILKRIVYVFHLNVIVCEAIIYQKYLIGLVSYSIYSSDAVKEILHMSYTDFHKMGSGKTQTDLFESSWGMFEWVICAIVEIPQYIALFIMCGFLFFTFFNAKVLAFFFGCIFLTLLFTIYSAVVVHRHEEKISVSFSKSCAVLSDILINYDIVKAFNKEHYEKECYKKYLAIYEEQTRHCSKIQHLLKFFQSVLFFIPHFSILFMIATGYVDTGLKTEQLLLYNDLFIKFKNNLIAFVDCVFKISVYWAQMKRRLNFTEYKEDPGIDKVMFKDTIKLQNVCLYADKNCVQKDLNLEFKRGDKVAISGLNGCGKSTLIKTLVRFFKHSGDFTIDGIPIEQFSEKGLRRIIAYVPQNPFIFNNTVLYNLAYSQSAIDEQEIYKKCQEHGLHEFFKGLKDGYHTQAGQNGVNLSGGQKQRINYMRAIIKDAPIIVLDEPTASMDKKSEAGIINDLLANCENKTVFVIVHNHLLLKRFSKILYFTNDGVDTFTSFEDFENRRVIKSSTE